MESKVNQEMLARVREMAEGLSALNFESVLRCLEGKDCTPDTLVKSSDNFSQSTQRRLIQSFASAWVQVKNSWPSLSIRGALLALRNAGSQARGSEIVWTGPDNSTSVFRATEQVLVEMIEQSCSSILLVTYAVYEIQETARLLVEAAQRGVQIQLILETINPRTGVETSTPIRELGSELTSLAEIYYWPFDQRPTDDRGNRGCLHIKCAVADEERVLITSANLTQSALRLNMEMGLAIRDPQLGSTLSAHFANLISASVLMPLR